MRKRASRILPLRLRPTTVPMALIFLSLLVTLSLRAASFPDPLVDETEHASKTEKAVLAGGCFWGTEAIFERLKGVKSVVSGYAGGEKKTAHSDQVETGKTGHTESVMITYDPSKITYGQILKVFFSVAHDPTQLNRQGGDVGTQYRSAIFYSGDEQKKIAEGYVSQLESGKVFSGKIVTEVVPLKGFYPAEDFLQHYSQRHPDDPYVLQVDAPKVRALHEQYPDLTNMSKD